MYMVSVYRKDQSDLGQAHQSDSGVDRFVRKTVALFLNDLRKI
jgi:hypothetical protein